MSFPKFMFCFSSLYDFFVFSNDSVLRLLTNNYKYIETERRKKKITKENKTKDGEPKTPSFMRNHDFLKTNSSEKHNTL